MLVLAAVCFASIDRASRVRSSSTEPAQHRPCKPRRPASDRQRPDLRLPAAPPLDRQGSSRHSAICPSGTLADLAGARSLGNPQAGMFYPPVWAAWLGPPSLLGWLTVGHLIWGGHGGLSCCCDRSLRGAGLRRWPPAVYLASPFLLAHTFEGHYPHVWAAAWYPWAFWASAGRDSDRARPACFLPVVLAMAFLAGHPQEWLLLVLALSAWSLADAVAVWRARGARQAASRLLRVGRRGGLVARDRRTRAGTAACRPALAAARSRRSLASEHSRRYHLEALNGFQLLSPTALGGPADYFGQRQLLGDVALDRLGSSRCSRRSQSLRHPDRKLVRGWLVLVGLARLVRVRAASLAVYRSLLRRARDELVSGAGALALPRESRRRPFWPGSACRRSPYASPSRAPGGDLPLGAACCSCLIVLRSLSARAGTPAGQSRAIGRGRPAGARGRLAFVSRSAASRLFSSWDVLHFRSRAPRLAGGLIGLLALCELGWHGNSLLQVAPAEQFLGADPVSEALERLEANSAGAGPRRIKARDNFYGDLRRPRTGSRRRTSTTSSRSITPRGCTSSSIRSPCTAAAEARRPDERSRRRLQPPGPPVGLRSDERLACRIRPLRIRPGLAGRCERELERRRVCHSDQPRTIAARLRCPVRTR